MCTEFTKVEASTREAFYDTLLMFWDQHWEKEFQQEFLAWRYGRRTDGETLVAMSGSKCIGVIDSFIRPYRRQEVLVREPCDWYWLPGNRGVGMRLLRFLIAQGEPLLAVGLSKGTMAIAPRMNWTRLLDTHHFILPLTARRVAGAILRKRLGDGSVAMSSRVGYAFGQIPRGRSIGTSMGRSRTSPRRTGPARIGPTWLKEAGMQWRPSSPRATSNGCPRAAFARLGLRPRVPEKRALVGLTICRIEASKVGRKAKLIHLQSSELNMKTLRWMIAENVYRAAQLEAESVLCRSSCLITNAALASLRFHPTANEAVMVRFNGLPIPSGPVNVTFLRGDDVMIPSLIAE
jgi:hypothetical protein